MHHTPLKVTPVLDGLSDSHPSAHQVQGGLLHLLVAKETPGADESSVRGSGPLPAAVIPLPVLFPHVHTAVCVSF